MFFHRFFSAVGGFVCVFNYEGEKTNEIRLGVSNQGENQPSKFRYVAQNAGRREAFGTVSMGYGGQLCLDAFRKYSDSFAKCTRRKCTAALEGITIEPYACLANARLTSSFEGEKTDEIRVRGSKQGRNQISNIRYEPKVGARQEASGNALIGHGYTRDIPSVAPTVAYSQLCTRNVWARRSSVLTQTPVVDGFHAKQTTGPNVFRKYAAVCAKNTRPRSNRGPGTSGHSIGGKIYMKPEPDPQNYIKSLLQNKHFIENIHAYNQMFSMTSFGAKIDESINTGRGPYVFKVSSQVYHWRGSLCPPVGEAPRFLQLYIYDTDNKSGYHTKLKVMPADGSGEAKWLTILAYYRTNYTIRLNRLYDAISRGEQDGYEVRGRIILLMSFTGGPRYMYAHYLDALAICRKLCNPQFFITFTCNVNWLEIRRYMAQYPQLMTSDSVDIVCRVFEQKIHTLVAFLKKERTFGNVMGGTEINYKKSSTCLEELVALRNSKSSIGRLAYVHPTSVELFFLQMLLCYQKGCRDFWEMQTVKGIFYPTYRAACEALNLLGDDKECDIAIQEACASATPAKLRSLFAHILLHCDVTDPSKQWTKYWKEMNHDMPEKVSQTVQILGYHRNDDGLQGYTLYEIEVVLNNCIKSLQNFGLPPPPEGLLAQLANRLLMGERNYNQNALMQKKNESVPKLNAQQKIIYDLIINVNARNRQKLIFVYGHGGTGKTFMWKTIIGTLHSEGKFVMAVWNGYLRKGRKTKPKR
ncbi:DNA helicase [Tanacetum coccineum]